MSKSWSRWLPLTGVVFVILLLVSVFLPGNGPSGSASGATVITYAKAHKNSLDAAAIVIAFSLFFGLFFYGQLRGFLRRDPANEQLAAISFGGAVLFAAGGGIAAGMSLALADSPSKLDPSSAQALNIVASDLPLVMFSGLGVLMVAAGIAIVRSRILSVWLGWVGIVFGVVAILPLGPIGLVLGAIWTLATSIIMTLQANAVEPVGATSTTTAMA